MIMLRAADSSITRGNTGSGIVGNARKVLSARNIISSAVYEPRHSNRITEWRDHSRIVDWQEKYGSAVEMSVDARQEVWVCPNCKQAM